MSGGDISFAKLPDRGLCGIADRQRQADKRFAPLRKCGAFGKIRNCSAQIGKLCVQICSLSVQFHDRGGYPSRPGLNLAQN